MIVPSPDDLFDTPLKVATFKEAVVITGSHGGAVALTVDAAEA
jgi:hypothetical protein